MTYFRNTVAVKCGINAAIVAEIIWELQKTEFDKSKTVYHRHRRWCRCSQPMITIICPALSVHMVKDAIKTLNDMGVIRKECFNEDKFDHTNWYAFTEYGCRLMNEGLKP